MHVCVLADVLQYMSVSTNAPNARACERLHVTAQPVREIADARGADERHNVVVAQHARHVENAAARDVVRLARQRELLPRDRAGKQSLPLRHCRPNKLRCN